jgi:hypothetical protein
MSERFLFAIFYNDKTITNPINKTEIFTCSELYSDYRKCKSLIRKGLKSKRNCREIRVLGQKCYLNDEEDFEKHLIKIFEEKRKYIQYLKDEGSILYQYYRSDPTVFSLKKLDEMEESDLNDMITNKEI